MEMLPSPNWKEWDENIKHFLTRVRLDETPARALPLMSAQVEFDTGRVPDALVVPVEAVAVGDHQESCYVITRDGLERRSIRTRRATRNLLEVIAGLDEGERVVARSLDVQDIPFVDKTSDGEHRPAPEQAVSFSAKPLEMRAHAG
jgi:multidrug efflux pump subunit AcrA (membrane-fusion protein)